MCKLKTMTNLSCDNEKSVTNTVQLFKQIKGIIVLSQNEKTIILYYSTGYNDDEHNVLHS